MSFELSFPTSCVPAFDQVAGYHGTTADKGRTIFNGQEFKSSQKRYDWLGDGIYFWQDYEDRAWRWAEYRYPGKEIGVVKAKILVGTCLDFGFSSIQELFRVAGEELERRLNSEGKPIPQNDGVLRRWDRAVINFMCDSMTINIDTVRAIYSEGQQLMPGSSLRDLAHIHLCVRNPRMISEIVLTGVKAASLGTIYGV